MDMKCFAYRKDCEWKHAGNYQQSFSLHIRTKLYHSVVEAPLREAHYHCSFRDFTMMLCGEQFLLCLLNMVEAHVLLIEFALLIDVRVRLWNA